ncbi:hypothetical protein NQ317_008422 [Molorchus minor]|uniref:SET and MYND domain-containing protein 4 n=1 Tax=Molorchus minor TaxID=1323400 RepID=A0ABQ9JFT5_9CUCU|nr:hypothetical protein NQ317_008422 [Molorchus minor]
MDKFISNLMTSSKGTFESEMFSLVKDAQLASHEEHFKMLKGTCDRVDFIYSLLKKSAEFKKIFSQNAEKKSNEKSMKLRTEGNNMYIREKNMLKALELYTESIAFAESGSWYLALSYANRSSVLFEKRYYKECIKDIERAFQNDYPGHLKEKLLNRKGKAESLKEYQKQFQYYMPAPTIQNKNPLISAASDSVEIRKNEKYGRHVVSTKDIQVGEVISVENSFAHIILPKSRFINCHECLEICYNMIPCERCTLALYCTETCRDQAYTNYHKYECELVPLLHTHSQLSIRMALIGLKQCGKMGDTYEDETFCSDRFKEILELSSTSNERDFINTCIYLSTVCVAYHSLMRSPSFQKDFDINSIDGLLKDYLYRAHIILRKKVATAMYVFTGIFNHSCVPNCEFFHHGSNLVIRAIANIKKGEQCTICYGISFSTTNILYRQRTLKNVYMFDCDCKACINKWPVFDNLPLGKPLPTWFEAKMMQNTFENTKNWDEILPDVLHLYNAYEKYEPCQNLLLLQNLISEMLTDKGCNKDLDF